MGNIYFSTSNGWLANLRKRHQIVFHKVCGGAGNVCEETVTDFMYLYRMEPAYKGKNLRSHAVPLYAGVILLRIWFPTFFSTP